MGFVKWGLNTLKDKVVKFFFWLLTLLSPVNAVIVTVVFLIVVDFVTGAYASFKNTFPRHSSSRWAFFPPPFCRVGGLTPFLQLSAWGGKNLFSSSPPLFSLSV